MDVTILAADEVALDTGNTAWLLISAALVLLMTPGLAFFYGGMVRAKSVLNMMMMSFGVHQITLVVRDDFGVAGIDTLDVVVRDTQPPSITAPKDIHVMLLECGKFVFNSTAHALFKVIADALQLLVIAAQAPVVLTQCFELRDHGGNICR